MTDIDVEVPEADELETEVAETEGTETTATAAADKAKRKKDDLPDGVVTPTGLTNYMNKKHEGEPDWVELTPQQMYGWFKNGKDFPRPEGNPEGFHTDGRFIVELRAGEAWVEQRVKEAAERRAKKAAKAVEATKEEAKPEVEADTPDVDIA